MGSYGGNGEEGGKGEGKCSYGGNGEEEVRRGKCSYDGNGEEGVRERVSVLMMGMGRRGVSGFVWWEWGGGG